MGLLKEYKWTDLKLGLKENIKTLKRKYRETESSERKG